MQALYNAILILSIDLRGTNRELSVPHRFKSNSNGTEVLECGAVPSIGSGTGPAAVPPLGYGLGRLDLG